MEKVVFVLNLEGWLDIVKEKIRIAEGVKEGHSRS